MTETEKRLLEEKEKLNARLKEIDAELIDYRKSEEDRINDELNQKFKNKIVRERLWDVGLSSANRRERTEDYRLVLVEKVNFRGRGFIQFTGKVFEMVREDTYLNSAKHIRHEDVFEAGTSFYHDTQINIYDEDLLGPYELDDPEIKTWIDDFDSLVRSIRDEFGKVIKNARKENKK